MASKSNSDYEAAMEQSAQNQAESKARQTARLEGPSPGAGDPFGGDVSMSLGNPGGLASSDQQWMEDARKSQEGLSAANSETRGLQNEVMRENIAAMVAKRKNNERLSGSRSKGGKGRKRRTSASTPAKPVSFFPSESLDSRTTRTGFGNDLTSGSTDRIKQEQAARRSAMSGAVQVAADRAYRQPPAPPPSLADRVKSLAGSPGVSGPVKITPQTSWQ